MTDRQTSQTHRLADRNEHSCAHSVCLGFLYLFPRLSLSLSLSLSVNSLVR